MPKTKTPTKHRVLLYKRPFVVAIVLILLIVVVAVAIIIYVNRPSITDSEPDQSPTGTNEPLGTQSGQAPSSTTPDSPNPKPTPYEGDDPNTLNELTGSIPYQHVAGNTLTISAMIDQYLTNDGVCELTLTGNQGYSYTTSVVATADVTTSVCEPFQVDLTNFPSDTYQIKIQVTGDGKTGIISGEVQL